MGALLSSVSREDQVIVACLLIGLAAAVLLCLFWECRDRKELKASYLCSSKNSRQSPSSSSGDDLRILKVVVMQQGIPMELTLVSEPNAEHYRILESVDSSIFRAPPTAPPLP